MADLKELLTSSGHAQWGVPAFEDLKRRIEELEEEQKDQGTRSQIDRAW
jgi:hypothetical protein